MTRLPVLDITVRSYAFLWQERRILALPMLILILLMAVIPNPADPGIDDWLTILIAASPTALFMPAFEVGLFRRILLGEPRRHFALFCLNRALVTYSVAGLKLFLYLAMAAIPAAILLSMSFYDSLEEDAATTVSAAAYAGLFFGGLALLLIIRLILVLPSAATGTAITFREASGLAKGNGMRLIAIVALTVAPLLIIPAAMPLPLLAAILQALAVPVRAMALALSYRLLTEPAVSEASAVP